MQKGQVVERFSRPGVRTYAMGKTFDCAYLIPADSPTVSLWLLQLLNVFVVVSTNVENHRPPPRPLTSWLT